MANNKNHTGLKIGFAAASLAAAAAAAAGAYFFYGSGQAAKNRKQMKGWMVKARGEVMEKIEGLKEISEKNYRRVIKEVLGRYEKLKNVDPKEIEALNADLKKSWSKIYKTFSPAKAAKPKPRKTKR